MKYYRILMTGLIALSLLNLACSRRNQTTAASEEAITKQTKNPNAAKTKKPSIRVVGDKLVNEYGEVVRLHGVSIMGMEYTAIHGINPDNPYPTIVESTWKALRQWNVNAIRIPLNELSYLGTKCVVPYTGPTYGKPGKVQESDPGHNYRKRLAEVVERATAENLYIILDLHFNAPNDHKNVVDGVADQCPGEMNPLPDADHAIDFWRTLAAEYKDHDNVMFELFNNPYIDEWPYFNGDEEAAWRALRDGAEIISYRPLWPTPDRHTWKYAGLQQLVNAIRSTGAKNVVLQGGLKHSSNLSRWLEFKAQDPQNQLAAALHAFPADDLKWNDKCYVYPGTWCDERLYSHAEKIMNEGYPVIVTEFGDKDPRGAPEAPFSSSLLPRLDHMSISYLAWSFSETHQVQLQLIKDNSGTPTDGYGEYVKAHYTCLAKAASCSVSDRSQKRFDQRATDEDRFDTSGWSTVSPPI